MNLAARLTVVLLAMMQVWTIPAALARENQDARMKTLPEPEYPTFANWFGWEGHCDVHFAVDEEGFTFAVEPFCTRKIFCFEAKRSVTATKFFPARVDGVPVVRTRVVIPLEFAFEGSDYDGRTDPRPLEPCEASAVS